MIIGASAQHFLVRSLLERNHATDFALTVWC
jgi:hypothetical protein